MKKTDELEVISYRKLVQNILPQMLEVKIPLNEGRIYLALLLEPGVSASRLCEITGIPDSKVYGVIENALKLNMIEVQYGVPKTYRATAPAPFISELKSTLRNRYENSLKISEKIEAQLQEVWAKMNGEHTEDNGIEIAYVVKGTKNIISKMKEMLLSAKHEIMIILPDFSKFTTIREQLLEAKLRGAKIKIAMPQNGFDKLTEDSSRNFNLSVLSPQCCDTWLLLADGRLLTVSGMNSSNEMSAILTRDRVLVQMSEAYFDNPLCCFSP